MPDFGRSKTAADNIGVSINVIDEDAEEYDESIRGSKQRLTGEVIDEDS